MIALIIILSNTIYMRNIKRIVVKHNPGSDINMSDDN